MVLGPEDDELHGGGGNDTVGSESGNDKLFGDDGDDIMFGGEGNDKLYGGTGNDQLAGDAGNDWLFGGDGNDGLNRGIGLDTVSYYDATVAVTVSLLFGEGKLSMNVGGAIAQNTGGAGTDVLTSIENLIGSAFNDKLIGDNLANLLEGGDGNDQLFGGNGLDTASYESATSGVIINLAVRVQNTGGAGVDQLKSIENLIGSGFNDKLTGNSANNVLEGGLGDDWLDGKSGSDTVSYAHTSAGITINIGNSSAQQTGGAGVDTLRGIENINGSAYADQMIGNAKANLIYGDLGADTLTGGAGRDKFFYKTVLDGGDLLVDFVSGQDKLLFDGSAFGATAGKVGAESFFAAHGAVAQTSDQHFIYDTNTHILYYDADGSGAETVVMIAILGNAANVRVGDLLIA